MTNPLPLKYCKALKDLFPECEHSWMKDIYGEKYLPSSEQGFMRYEFTDIPCPSLEEILEKLKDDISELRPTSSGWECHRYISHCETEYAKDKDPKIACALLLAKLNNIEVEDDRE